MSAYLANKLVYPVERAYACNRLISI